MTAMHNRRKDDPKGMWDFFVAAVKSLLTAVGLCAASVAIGLTAGYYYAKQSKAIDCKSPVDCGSKYCKKEALK